jgi:hypothetical protein
MKPMLPIAKAPRVALGPRCGREAHATIAKTVTVE